MTSCSFQRRRNPSRLSTRDLFPQQCPTLCARSVLSRGLVLVAVAMMNVGIVRMLVPSAPAVGSLRRHGESATSKAGRPETQKFLHCPLHHGLRRDLTCSKPVRELRYYAWSFCTMARRFGY